jgi:hypothetical protein
MVPLAKLYSFRLLLESWSASPQLVAPRKPRPAGWAEVHQVARAGMAPENMVMIYGPRDEHEADIIFGLLHAAYRYAGGRVPEKEVASEE